MRKYDFLICPLTLLRPVALQTARIQLTNFDFVVEEIIYQLVLMMLKYVQLLLL